MSGPAKHQTQMVIRLVCKDEYLPLFQALGERFTEINGRLQDLQNQLKAAAELLMEMVPKALDFKTSEEEPTSKGP